MKQIKSIKKLKEENRALKATCEILADREILEGIQKSLEQIRQGKGIPLHRL